MNQTVTWGGEPLWREIAYGDAFELALRLAGRPGFVFLDSAMRHDRLGRYSYLASDAAGTVTAGAGGTGLREMRQVLAEGHMRAVPGLPPFQGGLAGYAAYEWGRLLEPRLARRTPAPDVPPLHLNIYDRVAAFDHARQRAYLISTGYPEPAGPRRLIRARERLDELAALLARPPAALTGHGTIGDWASNFTRARYEDAVRRVIAYILDGDIFQANISQRYTADIPVQFNPLKFYERLRKSNAAPFSAYLDFGDVVIASSSPERLAAFDGITAEARPIKGTRRREPDPRADAAAKAELLASRKDRAENVMIVDLLRNDLSRVCDPGTVDVPTLCGLESYATVHHLTSAVTGRLSAGLGAPDLLAALFPGGSITGAPKLRAIEIIGEIERVARNIYCGSIGFMSFSGPMDMNIAIRGVLFHKGRATLHGGGGITARSDPSAEYEETLAKIQRILETIQGP